MGLTLAQADRLAEDNGLTLSVEERFYSDTVAEGGIVSQLPAEGVRVRRGGRVRVGQSLGAQRAQIPNLVGQSSRAAQINVQRRGLQLGSLAMASVPGTPPGTVIAQSPPPDATGVTAPRIHLLVSSPQEKRLYLMPSFIGRHLADAAAEIDEAGFQLGEVADAEEAAPAATITIPVPGSRPAVAAHPPSSIIMKQKPAAGQKVEAGATIDFEITR